MAEYERAGQILPENGINSKISKSLVFDLPCESTEKVVLATDELSGHKFWASGPIDPKFWGCKNLQG